MVWDDEAEKEIKEFLIERIREARLMPKNIRMESSFMEPHQNLVEFVLIGIGTIEIELTGGNMQKAVDVLTRLENRKQ